MNMCSTFLAICLEGGQRMEAVSMTADMRLLARSLACRPVGEHRAMAGGDDDDNDDDDDEEEKNEGRGIRDNACYIHQPRSFYKFKITKCNPYYVRDNVQFSWS